MLRCAITDRSMFPGEDSQRQTALLRQVALWAHRGLDLIQLREKDLAPADLAQLASRILDIIATASSPTRLLVNASSAAVVQLAIEARAHGVHLPAGNLTTPDQIRGLYAEARLPPPIVTVSCHTVAEVERAREQKADAIFFAPVFGKSIAGQLVTAAAGIETLREACAAAAPVPVYALGGVTHENAALCLKAGAAGVAGIRLFVTL